MAEIIVIGHGNYATGIQSNLNMVCGCTDKFHFIDFLPDMDRSDLEEQLDVLLTTVADKEVLFCCDLPGATPFQVAAVRTASHNEMYQTIAGLNCMAFMEMALDSALSVKQMARRAVETSKESIVLYPD